MFCVCVLKKCINMGMSHECVCWENPVCVFQACFSIKVKKENKLSMLLVCLRHRDPLRMEPRGRVNFCTGRGDLTG